MKEGQRVFITGDATTGIIHGYGLIASKTDTKISIELDSGKSVTFHKDFWNRIIEVKSK